MELVENNCLNCVIDQQCCKVLGLKLSKSEYEKSFADISDKLRVVKYDNFFMIYPRDNQPCPHWREDGCSIYQDRPVDCRLYPYELHRMSCSKGQIEVDLYDQSDCPHKENLFIPVQEAKALITNLVQEIYGADKPVTIHYIPGAEVPRKSGLLNRLINRISSLFRKAR